MNLAFTGLPRYKGGVYRLPEATRLAGEIKLGSDDEVTLITFTLPEVLISKTILTVPDVPFARRGQVKLP